MALTEAPTLLSIDWEPARPPDPPRLPSGELADVAPLTAPLTVPARAPPALAEPDLLFTEWLVVAAPTPLTEPVTDCVAEPSEPTEPPTLPTPLSAPLSEPVRPPAPP